MRKQIKIQACSSPSIEDAFKGFLLHKKASGIAEKTLRSYSQQFSAVSKFIDSSIPIDQLVKRQLEEMLEQMRDSGLKDIFTKCLVSGNPCAQRGWFPFFVLERNIPAHRWKRNENRNTFNYYS